MMPERQPRIQPRRARPISRLNWTLRGMLLLYLCGSVCLPPASRETRSLACDPAALQSGDIIFRLGRSLISQLVLSADQQSAFSHAGIIKKTGEQAFVIHAVTGESPAGQDVVKMEPLETFLRVDRAAAAAVYRLSESLPGRAEKAVAAAAGYAQQRIAFDSDFDLHTADRLYCTEMVWRAYLESGLDLTAGQFDHLFIPLGKDDYILPSTLQKSHLLQPVCLIHAER